MDDHKSTKLMIFFLNNSHEMGCKEEEGIERKHNTVPLEEVSVQLHKKMPVWLFLL